ncbi:MAG TPA: phosphoenolpyruvate synthase [Solirubrobacteraceae bacterium]|nr:phosphoenolpyruvate synthase [Solirubrobacteraceae bacterium]
MSTLASVVVTRPLGELGREDVAYAGGKGANLGELTRAGVPVPEGFVVGAPAYAAFCAETGLRAKLADLLEDLDVEDTEALASASASARALFDQTPMPAWLEQVIRAAYVDLPGGGRGGRDRGALVAVRSSATAEDTASASFAGMNETFLGIRGAEETIDAVRRCWRSLFGSRTVYYRSRRGYGQADMDIAVVVQRQLASTRSGVMFTVDPASGAPDRLVIEGAFGLGEAVVSGSVSPDRYVVEKGTLAVLVREVRRKELAIELAPDGGTATRELLPQEAIKPALDEREVAELAEMGRRIEEHYGTPQDTEWAFDADGKLWMLQSRPITSAAEPVPASARMGATPGGAAQTGAAPGTVAANGGAPEGTVLVRGLGAAPGVGSGRARVLTSLSDAERLREGDVLVTHMTAPDWVPLMRRAAAIVTDSGGMTCHAAIVSRELGIPCVVGTGDATAKLRDDEPVTVDATRGTVSEGLGAAAAGQAAGPTATAGAGGGAGGESAPTGAVTGAPGAAVPDVGAPATGTGAPVTGTRLLVNLSEPSQVARASAREVDGVGLLRAELMLIEALGGRHPRALIEEGHAEELVERLADALLTFAAGFAPRPITYRTVDFRTNEFRNLEGGEKYEPEEANPMIGYRGALRYTREPDLLMLELKAIARVWEEGHENFHVMLPFVRTVRELEVCRELVADSGLLGRRGFELWVMAEVPSVLFNLERYAELGIAGISIGSNDLTQLLLGADRDSELLAQTFDERDGAVLDYLSLLIGKARALGLRTSICGQAPSVHPEYAELLVRLGIDSVSVSLDAVERTRRSIAAAERRMLLKDARGS